MTEIPDRVIAVRRHRGTPLDAPYEPRTSLEDIAQANNVDVTELRRHNHALRAKYRYAGVHQTKAERLQTAVELCNPLS